MRARWLVAVPVSGLVALAACVDLFHGTDFETLCGKNPSDPQCTGTVTDGANEASDGASVEADVVEKPIPDFCAWKSNEAKQNAERACAWLTACVPPLGSTQLAECLINAQLAYDCYANPNLRPHGKVEKAWGCLTTVTSCAEADACVFPEGRIKCTVGEAGTGESVSCGAGASAPVRLRCVDTTVEGFDFCHLTGRTCGAPKDGGVPDCVPSTAKCDGTRKCAGTVASDCDGIETIDRGIDCQDYGDQRCDLSASQGPGCRGNDGGACNFSDVVCEGSLAKACVGQREIAVDCSKLGLACEGEDAGAIDPPPTPYAPWRLCAQTACDPSLPAKCVNGSVEVCVRGATRTLSCKANGFAGCNAGRCTP